MKRIACLLVAVMLLACLPLTAFAAKAGDTVTIDFTVETNPGLTGYKAIINYDETALKLVNVTVSAGTSDLNGNSVAVMSANPITDTTLFTATFEVLEGAKFGETYAVTATVEEAYDANVDEVALTIAGGEIAIAACEHVWGEWTGTEATCGAAGELTRTCTICGATETSNPEATGKHEYANWVFVDEEFHEGTCSCGATHKEAHAWDNGKVTVEPTAEQDGVRTFTCAVCGGTKTEVEEYVDNVPNTGDMTSVITLGAVALVVMMGAVVVVAKRKIAE